jgi:hypothetical protein
MIEMFERGRKKKKLFFFIPIEGKRAESFPHSLRRLSVTLGKFPHKKKEKNFSFLPLIVSFRILFIILTHSLDVSLPSEINISSLGVLCVCSAFSSSSVEMFEENIM